MNPESRLEDFSYLCGCCFGGFARIGDFWVLWVSSELKGPCNFHENLASWGCTSRNFLENLISVISDSWFCHCLLIMVMVVLKLNVAGFLGF